MKKNYGVSRQEFLNNIEIFRRKEEERITDKYTECA